MVNKPPICKKKNAKNQIFTVLNRENPV